MSPNIHKVDASILRSLRRTETARYSELQHPSGLSSDQFKFYLRKLAKSGYVTKGEDGSYMLTPKGKEFANNLDAARLTIQKQPKLSVCLIVSRLTLDGNREYLFQERMRQPFIHHWGFLSGPVRWDESFEAAASRELLKQTGLQATMVVRSFCRIRDYSQDDERLLEDKLFVLLTTDKPAGTLRNDWTGGKNAWLTLDNAEAKDKVFATTDIMLDALKTADYYIDHKVVHYPDSY